MGTDSDEGMSSKRPVPGGFASWTEYWTAQGIPWRTEPEIDEERQRFLAERRATPAAIERSTYPFKGISLSRADVEWLLSTHEEDHLIGVLDTQEDEQRRRRGLNLCGADLRWQDFSGLPLDNVALAEADLTETRLHATVLRGNLAGVRLIRASLIEADLERADLRRAQLGEANLTSSDLWGADLQEADLAGAVLEYADLSRANLGGASLRRAKLSYADLHRTVLVGADLTEAVTDHVCWSREDSVVERKWVLAWERLSERAP